MKYRTVFNVFAGIGIGVAALVSLGAGLVFVLIELNSPSGCILPDAWHLYRLEHPGGSAWGDTVKRQFDRLRQCTTNPEALARRLLRSWDGTTVSLGMDLVVLENLDHGDELLRKRFTDYRWNQNLYCNDNYARALLGVWKLKRGLPLTEQESGEMQCNQFVDMYDFFSAPAPTGPEPVDCTPYQRVQKCRG